MELDFATKKFDDCYNAYATMLLRLAVAQLGKRTDAEDIVQEVFIKWLCKRDFSDGNHEKLWLIRVTVNLCRNRLKSESYRSALPLEDFYIDGEDMTELKQEIAQALMSLPNDTRAVFHLHYFEGYKVNEIAKILRLSPSAVKMRLKRGREQLKLEWEV